MNNNDDNPPPETIATKREILIMSIILLAVSLNALDRTIIAVAMPRISDDFHALPDIAWYNAAFMLAAACSQLLFGRIYTYNPPKSIFIALVGLFELGNVICGAAPTSCAFIVGRAVAGLGSAGLMCGGIVVMVSVVPLAKRPLYQGLFGGVFTLASIVGPFIGGLLTDRLSWRWCFYINAPLGAVVMLVIGLVLHRIPPVQPGVSLRQQLVRIDPLGQILLIACVTCLILALQWGGTEYSWANGRIVTLLTMASVCMIAFGAAQYFNPKTAAVPWAICSVRSVAAGTFLTLCLNGTFQLFNYYQAIWFQAVRNASAEKSGIYGMAMGIPTVLSTLLAGIVVQKVGYYTPFALASSLLMPIGAGLLTTLHPHTRDATWIGCSVLLGCGIGLGMNQPATACQTVLAPEEVPIGLSLMFFWQSMAGAVFIPVANAVLNEHLVSGLKTAVSGLDAKTIAKAGVTQLRDLVPEGSVRRYLEVYNSALMNAFLVGVVLASLSVLGALGLEWRSVKKRQGRI